MSFNYGPISATALKLITKFGGQVIFSKPTSSAPADGARPWRGPSLGSPLARTVMGVITSFEQRELSGDRIRDTDIKLLVARTDAGWNGFTDQDIDLCTNVQVVASGKTYGCADVSDVAPNGTRIVMTFRLRLQ